MDDLYCCCVYCQNTRCLIGAHRHSAWSLERWDGTKCSSPIPWCGLSCKSFWPRQDIWKLTRGHEVARCDCGKSQTYKYSVKTNKKKHVKAVYKALLFMISWHLLTRLPRNASTWACPTEKPFTLHYCPNNQTTGGLRAASRPLPSSPSLRSRLVIEQTKTLSTSTQWDVS